MIEQTSELKTFFLLQFTKELIRHSESGEIFRLKNILESEKVKEKELYKEKKKEIETKEREIGRVVKERLKIQGAKEKFLNQNDVEDKKLPTRVFIPIQKRQEYLPILRIPEPKLPPRFQYLRPVRTNIKIDLGKLNPLIKDPAVSSIECHGPGKNVLVRIPSLKTTGIILDKEETDKIIKKFSETAKIPVSEGIFKVVAGGLILTAIVSEVTETKFTIKKIIPAPLFRR